MNKFLNLLSASVLIVILSAASGFTDTFTYGDNYANWPGQTTSITADENGTPLISGAEVVVSGNKDNPCYLQSITIFETDRRVWDSLFINTGIDGGAWDSWDYIVYDKDAAGNAGSNPEDFPVEFSGLYSVADSYVYETAEKNGTRTGHANGINMDALTLTTTGLLNSVTYCNNELVYTFNTGITLDSNFVIGYTPWCANDVFLTPVPEPAAIFMFGLGLIGLAGLGRKKFFKKA